MLTRHGWTDLLIFIPLGILAFNLAIGAGWLFARARQPAAQVTTVRPRI